MLKSLFLMYQIRNYDDVCDFAAYACANQVDGYLYLEHDVNDIKLGVREPRFINEMKNMEAIDDGGVEGFDDSEDERTTATTYRFDFTQLLNECNIVARLTFSSKKKMEGGEYDSEELDNSYPDESDDEKG
ncbi:hypothetical protein KIW84_012480 [Lathyrus oleraceus]|uniref:Uncharacterized protein n=1 Tax=Pisum sativum TaxID=3888 RepID=A0A9D5BHN8_PEA|nr:hypothetical protein KIW84_012480 [Pisum sativum]